MDIGGSALPHCGFSHLSLALHHADVYLVLTGFQTRHCHKGSRSGFLAGFLPLFDTLICSSIITLQLQKQTASGTFRMAVTEESAAEFWLFGYG